MDGEPTFEREFLHLGADLAAALLDLSRREAPREACGLLLGHPIRAREWRIERLAWSPNSADDPTEGFRIPGRAWARASRRARAEGLEVVGVFHSHPAAAPTPSVSDLAAARRFGEGLDRRVDLIAGRDEEGGWQLAAWRIGPRGVRRLEWGDADRASRGR
ncbi:MAG: Mov34/MPN/PAD-1 family protein [Planctomycetota bacterium]